MVIQVIGVLMEGMVLPVVDRTPRITAAAVKLHRAVLGHGVHTHGYGRAVGQSDGVGAIVGVVGGGWW